MEMLNLTGYWHRPPDPLELPEGAVHLWSLNLEWASNSGQDIGGILTADEQARAAAIRSSLDRKYFIAARGALRDILSRYVHRAPADIDLFYGLYGKPRLGPSCPTSRIHFNVSHAQSLGLLAVTRNGEVGIDVERIRPCGDFEMIAQRFFSPPEIQVLWAVPPTLREHAFLAIWTRKEAFTKALGVGLQMEWTSFDVSRAPDQSVQTTNLGATRWSIYPFLPALGYMGALAYEGSCPLLKFWQWQPLAPVSRCPEPPGAKVSSNNRGVDSIAKVEVSI